MPGGGAGDAVKLTAVFELPTFAGVILAAELIQAMPDVKCERDEGRDALRADYRTKKRGARYDLELRDGRLHLAFEGARRSLRDGNQWMQLLCADPEPWRVPSSRVALTLVGDPYELTLWGEVLSAESSSAEPLF